MNDLLVHGGTIVSDSGINKADLVINNGKISAIITGDHVVESKESFNANGLYVFPGLIDPHMHVQAPFQGITGDLTFFQQSIAAACKPINCELEAFQKAVLMAVEAECPLLVVHTTNKSCLDYAKKYQDQGYAIFVETCPHYLTLFSDLYSNPDKGHLAMCSPPLRSKAEAVNLWNGMKDGVVDITGSDDCTFTRYEKERFLEKDPKGNLIQDFRKVVNGISGLELRLPILLTEGYHKQGVDLSLICNLTSTKVAKVMGLYPQKGALHEGCDADIAFVDLTTTPKRGGLKATL